MNAPFSRYPYQVHLAGLCIALSAVPFAYGVNHNPVANDWSLSVSINESSGSKNRKIALNGASMPDGKPQTEEESDLAREETYIDALTAGLRHDVTDVYVPLNGTDLALQIRRNYSPATWGMYSGFLPEERPASAFGPSWTSNLGTTIEITRRAAGPNSQAPDMASVTDESGQQYSFALFYRLEAVEHEDTEDPANISYSWPDEYEWDCYFIPVPSSKTDQDALNCRLVRRTDGILELRKKYGSTLRYEMTSLVRFVTSNAPDDRDVHTFARLIEVEDRYGNKLNYKYDDTSGVTVIPYEIEHMIPGGGGPKILIETNTDGQVTKITDPNGGEIEYTYTPRFYSLASDSTGTLNELSTVTNQEEAVTTYTYAISEETSPVTGDLGSVVMHHDITGITDPLEQTYAFQYRFNTVRKSYSDGDGYYRRTGLQSEVATVTLPDSSVTSIWLSGEVKLEVNYFTRLITGVGYITTKVKDAAGNYRLYEFTNPQVESMKDFRSTYVDTGDFDTPKMFYFLNMNVRYFGSIDPVSGGTEIGTESFKFLYKAGMAPEEVTDFSGNVTQYEYDDIFSGGIVEVSWSGLNAQISGFYSDPTKEINALMGTKEYTYSSGRIMESITDQLGNQTVYATDSKGRRTSETITPDGTTDPISRTLFDFADSYQLSGYSYAAAGGNFVTRKRVMKLTTFAPADPTWVDDMVTVYIPDSKGRLWKEIVDPDGLALTTTYTYDANNNKRFVTDARGNVTEFQYDARNRLVKKINPATIDPVSGLPVATFTTWVYDARGNKVKQTDENGVSTLYEYDALNRFKHMAVDLNGNGLIDRLTDGVTPNRSVDLVTSYTYNALNAKLTTTDPRGTVTKMEYDALQRLVKKTDDYGTGRLNYITTFEYDLTKNPGGSVFDSSGFKPTTVTDPRGYVTEVTYDALYRPVLERTEYKTGFFAETHKTYDAVGNLTTVTDPLGTITKTTYDALRRPVSATAAFGTTLAATSTTDYTSTGLKWRTTDPLNRETTTEYDDAGRPIKVYAPAVDDALTTATTLVTPVTETLYDAAGNVIAVINPLGEQTDYTYDARNRRLTEQLPSVTDATTGLAARPLLTTTYDDVGNVVATEDARGNITNTTYDPARRPLTVTAPLVTLPNATTAHPVTAMVYDAGGNVLTLTDANGHVTTNSYDALNRLLTTTQSPTANSADDILVTNQYDPAGNRTAVIDGKTQRTDFTYDGLNRNLTIKDPANRTVTYAYNALNKTHREDSAGRHTDYTYDALHRLTDVAYPGRTQDNRTYAYDLVGQLLTVTEPGKTGLTDVGYTYDALGRQLTETSNGQTHAYAYDLANNRVTVTYGGTGTVLTSTYDALNRLATLTEGTRVTTYGYDLSGNRVFKQLPNGEEVDTVFDSLNRQTDIVTTKSGGGTLLALAQAYDLVGNVARITETYPGSTLSGRTVTNTYDGVNRLTVETAAESAQTVETTYTFDKANNRTEKSIATTTGSGTTTVDTTYTYNNLNQLVGSLLAGAPNMETTFTYDLDGNRATRTAGGETDTYAYDYENRLLGLTKNTTGGTGTYSYVYDYRTRRVQRTESGTVTSMVFSGGVSVQEYEVATATTLTAEYIRGSDWGGGVGGLLYSVRGGVASFKHYNSRGDVINETDATGTATWEATYEAYGTRTQEIGSTQDRQKANTKEEDPTGLLNEGFRYRDLETGTFITRDPLGFVDGPNMYAYVVQNPWSKFDPLGLSGTPVLDAVIGTLHALAAPVVVPFRTVFDNDRLTSEVAAGWQADSAASANAGRNGTLGALNRYNPLAQIYNGVVGEDLSNDQQLNTEQRFQNGVGGAYATALIIAPALGKGPVVGPRPPTAEVPPVIADANAINAVAKAPPAPPSPSANPNAVYPIVDDVGAVVGNIKYKDIPMGAWITAEGVLDSTMEVHGGAIGELMRPKAVVPPQSPPVASATTVGGSSSTASTVATATEVATSNGADESNDEY